MRISGLVALPLSVILAGCLTLDRRTQPEGGEDAGDADVFDVIRASNSRALLEHLQERCHEDLEHARLLTEEIRRLESIEAARAIELEEVDQDVRTLLDQVRAAEAQYGQATRSYQETATKKQEAEAQLQTLEAEIQSVTDKVKGHQESLTALQGELLRARELAEGLSDPSAQEDRAKLLEILSRLEKQPVQETAPAEGDKGSDGGD